jgi:putative DNA primase/helicase
VLLMPYMARFVTQEGLTAGQGHYLKDTRIADRLKGEGKGVLAWIVNGARIWCQDGLQPPDHVLAASRDYQTEQDRIGRFVDECCELRADAKEPLSGVFGGLYDSYRAWCGEGGMMALSKQKFTQELERVVPYMRQQAERRTAEDGTRKKLQMIYGIRLLEQ